MQRFTFRQTTTSTWKALSAVVFCLAAGCSPTAAVTSGTAEPPEVKGRICLVFTGSRLSELEPCGCHASQNGGIDREALLYQKLREEFPDFVAMEVGKWVDAFQSPNERLKTDYLVKAMHDLRFDVFNVTPYDLAFGTTYPLQLVGSGKGRFVAANLLVEPSDAPDKGLTRLFDPYAILELPLSPGGGKVRVGVIGVTDPAVVQETIVKRLRGTTRALPPFQLEDLTETLNRLVPEVKKKADVVVVLALMSRLKAQEAARKIEGIDLFVSTMDNQAWRNVARAGRSYCISTGQMGRFFSKAVLGFDGENRFTSFTGTLVDIPGNAKADKTITKYIEEYKTATKDLARRKAIAREKSRYAGRSRCLACHRAAYLQWSRTPHNLAYATLVRKRQHYNPDCLKCHTTGYGEVDGFIDTSQTGYLVSVQCEVCHGPGNKHAKALTELMRTNPAIRMGNVDPGAEYPRLLVTPEAELCKTCHDGDNDPHFEYERDIKLVSHQNADGPFRRPKSHAVVVTGQEPESPKPVRETSGESGR